jgi:hypothetical protein
MKNHSNIRWSACSLLVIALALGAPGRARAHCDGLDGPVVKAAQAALETRNPTLVLIWVQPKDEAEIRAAFEQTLVVRALSPQAKALADRYFFETLVRVHRAGEGAPYTGLKPAGRDLGAAIPAADKAIDEGSVEPLVTLITGAVQQGVRAHFKETMAARAFTPGDIAAGREYVKAYVEFIHYVERLHEAATTSAHGHAGEGERN